MRTHRSIFIVAAVASAVACVLSVLVAVVVGAAGTPIVCACSATQVEQLQFGNDEKSVMVKTVDGATQIVAVLPTAQVAAALARCSCPLLLAAALGRCSWPLLLGTDVCAHVFKAPGPPPISLFRVALTAVALCRAWALSLRAHGTRLSLSLS
jgi:hypothetical protein